MPVKGYVRQRQDFQANEWSSRHPRYEFPVLHLLIVHKVFQPHQIHLLLEKLDKDDYSALQIMPLDELFAWQD